MSTDYQEEIISLIKTYARLYYCVSEEYEDEKLLITAESKIRAELSQYGNARELQGAENALNALEGGHDVLTLINYCAHLANKLKQNKYDTK